MRIQKRSLALVGIAVLAGGAAFAELLGILPGHPLIQFNSQGAMEYDASSDFFSVSASPLAIQFAPGQPPRFINPTGDPAFEVLTLDIQVGSGGVLLGGHPDDDLVVIGEVDANGNGSIDYDGVLLTGEILAFGFEDTGTPTDFFDFRFAVTGGSLAGYFAGKDIGLVLTVENSTFAGHFDGNFQGGAKGVIGPIDQEDDDEVEPAGCSPGFWRQPHHFQYWVDYNPDDLFADAFTTAWVAYTTAPNSCSGSCGGQSDEGCWCDDLCCFYNDCCADKAASCGGCDPNDPASAPDGCDGACGGQSSLGCWCDDLCCLYNDCCGDKAAQCGGCDPSTASCAESCGGPSTGCWCDELCCQYNDCCPDKEAECGGCSAGGGVAGEEGSGAEGGVAGGFDPFPGKTLHDVLTQRASASPGPVHLNNLGRHAVAALLNAASDNGYPYSVEEVIGMFNFAYAEWLATGSQQTLNALKNLFDEANNLGCNVKNADLNTDGWVDGMDLVILLSNWGTKPDPIDIGPGDLNDDGWIDGMDLVLLLSEWGPVAQE